MRISGIFTFLIICSCTSNEGQQSISKPNKLSGEGSEIVKISETQSEGELNVQDVSGQFSDYLRLSIKYRGSSYDERAFIVILKNISERNLSISVDTNFFSGEIVVQNGSRTCLLEGKVIHKARLFGPGEWSMPPPRILKPKEEIKWTLLTRDLWSVSLEEEECDLFSPPNKEVFARLSRVAILNTAGEYTRPRGDYGSNKIDFLEGGKYYRIPPPHSVVVSVPKVNPDDYSDRDLKKLIDKLYPSEAPRLDECGPVPSHRRCWGYSSVSAVLSV